jgi:integration host factor subunit alpha
MNYFESNNETIVANTFETSSILKPMLTTLTKSKLVKTLYQRRARKTHNTDGLYRLRYESAELIESFFEEIRSELLAGREVKLSGFGNFEVRNKNARLGRNPRTGEIVPITARSVVSFHPSIKLKLQISK